MPITPFHLAIPDETLQDLQSRLAQTRWPNEISHSGWDYGSNLSYLKELVDYWQTGFDWRQQEAALNAFSHFRTDVDGLGIHFIHEKGVGPKPLPLILTHGWPSTIFELTKIIPLLADPARYGGDAADAFDVVVPSMPGYGFSDATQERGMNTRRIAALWAKLMTAGLGYQHFGAHGGDWGSAVSTALAYDHGERLVGFHITLMSAQVALENIAPPLTDAERRFLEGRDKWRQEEGAYGHIQGTKPQTLSYGLNDSPAGLAAWIVEKFRAWSDCGGDVETRFTKDELLTTLTIYWVTGTIGSSVRLYYENQRNPLIFQPGERLAVPFGFAKFPVEISFPPREWAERMFNVQRWTEMSTGGHFAAMEEPELLVEELRAFFRPLRP